MDKPVLVKELKHVKLEIFQDDQAQSPDEWGNEDLFLVGYHRDFYVDLGKRVDGKNVPGISQGLAQDIARGGKYEDGSENSEAMDYVRDYHIFGLEAYIHSGVVLALSREGNFPDRQWDVSQLGLVFVSRKERKDREKARLAAHSLITEWNDYLSGNVYGYNITSADGDNLYSCWGFIGDMEDNILPEAMKQAQYFNREQSRVKRLTAVCADQL